MTRQDFPLRYDGLQSAMHAPRIFISHSSAASPALAWKVHDALKAGGFDVLMDQARLNGGDEWRNEIYTWIARAHGAIVLLREPALESKWVRFELAALALRRWLEYGFKLVPVIIPPVTNSALRAEQFEPYDLIRLQTEAVDASNVDVAVQRVVHLFQPLLTTFSDTPVDRLETSVVKELPPEPDVLERAARLLQDSAGDRLSDSATLARLLFHAAVEKVRDAVAEIAAGSVSQSQVQKIIDIVVPFWVDPQSIIELAREAATPAGPHRILLLNARQPYLGKLYAQRAALQYPLKWEIVPVTNAAGDDLVGAVVAELRDRFRKVDVLLADATNEEIDVDIANTARLDPVIVIVGSGPTAQHMAELRARYPHCIFIVMVGSDIPDPATLAANEMIVLDPPIAAEREQAIRTHYVACYRLVANTRA